jgi:two-component system, NtrC family, sensor kinase
MVTGMREFLDRMIQSSASAIVAADRSGRILLMNDAAEELFGYSLEAMGRITSSDLYPPGTAHDLMLKLRDDQYGGKGKLPPTKTHILTSTGKIIPVEMTGGIIYESGVEMGTMGIYNDLRERNLIKKKLREAEAQLIQSEKMASIGKLAAGVPANLGRPQPVVPGGHQPGDQCGRCN